MLSDWIRYRSIRRTLIILPNTQGIIRIMGHSQSEKLRTHERILEVAARRFRERGIAGISISEIMGEVGVTIGGFYKHFPSREALVAEAVSLAFENTSSWNQLAVNSLSEAVDQYLSFAQGDDLPACSVFSCLTADIRRSSSSLREILDSHLIQALTAIEQGLNNYGGVDRGRKAATILAALVGAAMLACAASDERLAHNLLSGVSNELHLTYLGEPSSPRT
jgi:TetR/AcrR family transcriptional repressor of nem operon